MLACTSMGSGAGWKRLWSAPNRVLREAESRVTLTPRARWLAAQSRARFERRADAYKPPAVLPREIGRVESFRFILG